MDLHQNSTLVIAVNKGRPLASLLGVLESIGIKPTESPETSRKLVFPTSIPEISLLVLRGSDVATYVEHGIADIGMLGKDTLLEFPGQNTTNYSISGWLSVNSWSLDWLTSRRSLGV